jgi:hypothetical protein
MQNAADSELATHAANWTPTPSELAKTLDKVATLLDLIDIRESAELPAHRARVLLRCRRDIAAQSEALRNPTELHARVADILLKNVN